MDLQRPPEIYMAQYDEGVSPYQVKIDDWTDSFEKKNQFRFH